MGSRLPRFPDVDWYCDHCGSYLNAQPGFDDHKYTWKCTHCKGKNSISRDNIRTPNFFILNWLLDVVGLLRTLCVHCFLISLAMRLSPVAFFQDIARLKALAVSFAATLLVQVLIVVAQHARNASFFAMIFGTALGDAVRPYRELLRYGRAFRDIRTHTRKLRVITAITKWIVYWLIIIAEICSACYILYTVFGSVKNGMIWIREWLGNIDSLSKLYLPFILYVAGMNVVSFLAFGLDKYYAVHQKWRIKESTLFALSILFGAIGSVLGMFAFRHKTRKPGFRILLPILALLQIAIVAWGTIQYFF